MDIEADPDGLVGQVLVSRYRIEARLGHGAMGTVYRARHVKVGREFAIKMLHPRLLGDDKVRRRFAREAELAGSLHHPNIVSVVDTGDTPDGMSYLVMEYAAGRTLFDLIGDCAPMPGPRVIGLVRQLCAGLEHAHERGLIHRDFKPENVIISRADDGSDLPRIVDFGVAILRDDAVSSNADRLTTSGLVLGTPHYMAPEHATGAPIDHRIDLFALGVICFEMLTGRPPFDGDGVDVARANLMLDTPVMAVRVPNIKVDPLLEAFTRKLMMKARDNRPATARAARDLIDLIERDRPAAAAALGVKLDVPAAAPVAAAASPAPPAAVPAGQLLAQAFASPPPSSVHVAQDRPAPARSGTEPPRAATATPSDNAWSPQEWPRSGELTDEVAQLSRRGPGRIIAVIAGLAAVAAFALAIARRRPAAPSPPATLQAREPAPAPSAPVVPAPAAPEPTAPTAAEPAAPPATTPAPARPPPVIARPSRAPTAPPAPIAAGKPAAPHAPAAASVAAPPIPPPAAPTPGPAPATSPASASRVAQHYAAVGQRLKTLDRTRGSTATADLWTPYLRIRINEVMTDPVKREEAEGVLHHLDDLIASRGP